MWCDVVRCGAMWCDVVSCALIATDSTASLLVVVRSPRSDSTVACAHGRVSAVTTAIRLVVVLAASFAESMSPTVFITIVCVANVCELYGYLYYLPFYSQLTNQLRVGCSSVLVWASLCMVMAQVRNKPEVGGSLAQMMPASVWRLTAPCVVSRDRMRSKGTCSCSRCR
jgi:hypothetical protein